MLKEFLMVRTFLGGKVDQNT